ncbi:hypothetical protein Aperf_G00000038477 [Anoplocephala perfoliata]
MLRDKKRPCILSRIKPVKKRDQGWSWAVLIASFVIQLLCDGTIAGYGVILKNLRNDTYFLKRNYSEYEYALPGALQSGIYVVAFGLGGPLINLFGFQWVACIGGLLAGLSMLVGACFHDITGMVIFYGVFSGLGLGALGMSANIAVLNYFERFRGAACGTATAGSGLGYIIVPLFLSFLSRCFGSDVGWRSFVLVYSIILTVVMFLSGLTFRPIEIETPRDVEMNEAEQALSAPNTHLDSKEDTEAISGDDSKTVPENLEERNASNSEMDVNRQSQPIEKQASSKKNVSLLEESENRETVKTKPRRLCSRFLEWLVKFFDLTLFLDAGYIILCASFMAFQMVYFIPFTYFLTFATSQAGLAENDALLLITITGILHTIGRFVGGMMANIPRVDIVIVSVIFCLLCAACHFALPFLPHTFVALAFYSSGFGFFCAVPIPLHPLLFLRFLGLKRLTLAFSNSCIVRGITAAIGPAVAAKIYSSTSNLDGTFYWCGAGFAISALILFLLYLPFVKESDEK